MSKIHSYKFSCYEAKGHVVMEGEFHIHEPYPEDPTFCLEYEVKQRWKAIRQAWPTTYASLSSVADPRSFESGSVPLTEWLTVEDEFPEGWKLKTCGSPQVGDYVALPSDRPPGSRKFRLRQVEEGSPLLTAYVYLIVQRKENPCPTLDVTRAT